MRATLEFNLPEESIEFHTAIRSNEYYCALWDIQQRIRDILNHGEETTVISLCEQLKYLIPQLD